MDNELLQLAHLIYGEAGGEDLDTKKMVGSSVINRLNSGRAKEFGGSIEEVAQKGYYAVSKKSKMYEQAVSGNFPDKSSETAWKQSLAVASGLVKGTIKPSAGMFYFTDKEAKQQKKVGFKFSQVKETGKVGKFNTYSY